MPRKGPVARRIPPPDAVYESRLVSRLINQIMRRGKKSVAERVVYGAFEQIASRSGRDPLEIFEQALRQIMPMLEVKPRRVGGATYQVPMEVRPTRTLALQPHGLFEARFVQSYAPLREHLPRHLDRESIRVVQRERHVSREVTAGEPAYLRLQEAHTRVVDLYETLGLSRHDAPDVLPRLLQLPIEAAHLVHHDLGEIPNPFGSHAEPRVRL